MCKPEGFIGNPVERDWYRTQECARRIFTLWIFIGTQGLALQLREAFSLRWRIEAEYS
jgi:hypothetical protein